MDVKGISETKADKLVEASCKLVNMGFTSATEYNIQRGEIIRVSFKRVMLLFITKKKTERNRYN